MAPTARTHSRSDMRNDASSTMLRQKASRMNRSANAGAMVARASANRAIVAIPSVSTTRAGTKSRDAEAFCRKKKA